MSKRNAKIILALTGLVFVVFGVLFLTIPDRMMGAVQIDLNGPTAFAEIRAMYGGVQLALGLFFLMSTLREQDVIKGLQVAAIAMGGLALGRIAGILVDSDQKFITYTLLIPELIGFVLCLLPLVLPVKAEAHASSES